jgi:hypothetical protein
MRRPECIACGGAIEIGGLEQSLDGGYWVFGIYCVRCDMDHGTIEWRWGSGIVECPHGVGSPEECAECSPDADSGEETDQ